jgi:hypothetical protein
MEISSPIGLVLSILLAVVLLSLGALRRLRHTTCDHTFFYEDMEQVGPRELPPLPVPDKSAPSREWQRYFNSVNYPRENKRAIKWTCARCGEDFYGACGLDILENGTCIGNMPSD